MNIDDVFKSVEDAGSVSVSKEEIEAVLRPELLAANWIISPAFNGIYKHGFCPSATIFGFEVIVAEVEPNCVPGGRCTSFAFRSLPSELHHFCAFKDTYEDSGPAFTVDHYDYLSVPLIAHVRDMILARKQKAIFEAACAEPSSGPAKSTRL